MDEHELVMQVLTQVAAIIDEGVDPCSTKKPIDINEEVSTVGKKCKPDEVLLDLLALGRGFSDNDDYVVSEASHLKSFALLTQEGKRMRALDANTLNANLLYRINVVCQAVDTKAFAPTRRPQEHTDFNEWATT